MLKFNFITIRFVFLFRKFNKTNFKLKYIYCDNDFGNYYLSQQININKLRIKTY